MTTSPRLDFRVLTILVPTYNEELTILETLKKLTDLPNQTYPRIEVIVIDDCSTDNTAHIVNQFLDSTDVDGISFKLLKHERNLGKGRAIRTGISIASGDILIIQDADLEYDSSEIPSVIDPILQGKADVVYGSRFMTKKASRVLYFYHYLANKFLTFLSNLFTNMNMTDIETGYKAFRTDILSNTILSSNRFGFEVEVTAKIAKINCRVYEVPISYYGRTYEEGKKIGFMDGVKAIFLILYYNLLVGRSRSFRKHFLEKLRSSR